MGSFVVAQFIGRFQGSCSRFDMSERILKF